MPSTILETFDAQLDELFRSWNWLSTVLAAVLIIYLIYPLLVSEEADTHPLLLSRQANIAQIRMPGESAVYRSLDTPHGYPLKTGLNVKPSGAAKWAVGNDGDLRDIWRRAVQGSITENGMQMGEVGKIQTVLGVEKVVDHDMESISKEINVIGKHISQQGVSSVAVYLPNSVELLTVVFAAAFYGFTPVLIPYGLPQDVLIQLLQLANADFLVGAAGSVASDEVQQQCKAIKGIVWAAERASREVDFSDSGRNVTVWHELVDSSDPSTTSELPESTNDQPPPGVTSIWLGENPKHGELVTFTQSNIVAAVSAQLTSLPHAHRLKPSDLFLPTDSLTAPYILIQTLAALYSNASVALHSVAGHDIELPLAATGVSPTIIACSSDSLSKLHDVMRSKLTSTTQRFALRNQMAALKAGHFPSPGLLSSLIQATTVTLGITPGALRLIFAYERSDTDSPPLSSLELGELRAFTGAKIVYALTAPKVAGTVAQTNYFDYRVDESMEDARRPAKAHFGVPTAAVEVKVVDAGEYRTVEGGRPMGEVVCKGPAVLGGSANLGVMGTFREDGTLAYV